MDLNESDSDEEESAESQQHPVASSLPTTTVQAEPRAIESPVWWTRDSDEVLKKKWAEILFSYSIDRQASQLSLRTHRL